MTVTAHPSAPTTTGPVPLVDLAWQHAVVADEVATGWQQVLARTAFTGGPQVAAFEQEFARFSAVGHCVGVANGTDAIELALRAHGVGPGDEVIVPANTFIATAEAVARAGATPVLVDCRDDTSLIDVDAVADAVGPRTRAVVPVHLYGQAAAVERIRAVAPDVVVVEDAAQAQGASRLGVRVGGLGHSAATSFYPGKNLGAYGDGGAVLTVDDEVARRVRLLGAHGSPRKYEHPELGFNSRLDTLQAVVLSAKLRRLDEWNELRRAAAARYDALLADVDGVRTPVVDPDGEPVHHLYVVRLTGRDATARNEVLAGLNADGIGAGVHYPTPIHLTGAFAGLGRGPGAFPVAERTAAEILSLPIYPGVTAGQQERVVEVLTTVLARVRS